MPAPSLITDLSTVAASNSPAGTEPPSVLDDVQRAHAAFIAQLRDGGAFAQPIKMALGTASLPAYSFAGDLDTGVFSPGANQWAVAVNGIEQVRVDANGNWGFGAVSVGQKLEVTKNQNAPTAVVVRNTDAGALASSVVQLTNNTKFVNITADFTGNFFMLAGLGGIVSGFSRFDTHNWQTVAGVTTMTLSSTGLLTLVGAGATPAPNDNSKKVATTEYVKAEINRLGFTRVFKSADQTVTPNSTLNIAHGLGARPEMFKVTLKCVTAEANYSAGDEAEILQTVPGVSVIGVSADATNVIVGFTGGSTQVLNKTTQVATTITTTNWRFVARAYA